MQCIPRECDSVTAGFFSNGAESQTLLCREALAAGSSRRSGGSRVPGTSWCRQAVLPGCRGAGPGGPQRSP